VEEQDEIRGRELEGVLLNSWVCDGLPLGTGLWWCAVALVQFEGRLSMLGDAQLVPEGKEKEVLI